MALIRPAKLRYICMVSEEIASSCLLVELLAEESGSSRDRCWSWARLESDSLIWSIPLSISRHSLRILLGSWELPKEEPFCASGAISTF